MWLWVITALLWGMWGWIIECAWTLLRIAKKKTFALRELPDKKEKKKPSALKRLHAHPLGLRTCTNGWTFLMFALGMPLLLHLGYHTLIPHHVPKIVRGLIYGLGFWGAECFWGVVILLIGVKRVPWDYRPHPRACLNGLIRWDYLIPWMILGLEVEGPLNHVVGTVAPVMLQAFRTMPSPFIFF